MTLTEALDKKQMTPEGLADESGVHRATVYRLKNGEIANPSNDTVEKLELALKVRRGTLVFGQVISERAS